MSAARRRRKAMQRRNAWRCHNPFCGKALRSPNEVESGWCLSCLYGAPLMAEHRQLRPITVLAASLEQS